MIEVRCNRCGGTGRYSFTPRHGSTCFKCWGSGTMLITEAAYKARQRRAAKRQAVTPPPPPVKAEPAPVVYTDLSDFEWGLF